MFRTGAQMSILVLLTGLFLLWASHTTPLGTLESNAWGALGRGDRAARQFATAKGWLTPAPPAPVCLVAINESSVANHPWPWTPLDFSLYAQAVVNYQPEVVAVAPILDWDRTNLAPNDRQKLPQYEKILRESLLHCPKVLLASELGNPEDPNSAPPLREAPFLAKVRGNLRDLPEWVAIEREAKEEFRLSASIGFVDSVMAGGRVRALPLLYRFQGRVVPSFVLQAVLLWQKAGPDDITGVLGDHLQIGNHVRIPINRQGEMLVNFAAAYTEIGFDELLLAAEQIAAGQKTAIPVERFTHAVAVLGRTDRGAEKRPLAGGASLAQDQLLTAGIATIQSGAFLREAAPWVGWICLAVAVFPSLLAPRCRRGRVALLSALAWLAYLALAIILFERARLLLPLVLPGGLAVFIAIYRLATPNSVWKLDRPVIL